FEAKLRAKIASVTSGHNVTCFGYEVMISPLFRWPNSLCHYTTFFCTVYQSGILLSDKGHIVDALPLILLPACSDIRAGQSVILYLCC
ncbi:hypothetical protein EHW66_18210, partial [Erwinia psidii]|nr:hypothetical protein [Erwinia psidii]